MRKLFIIASLIAFCSFGFSCNKSTADSFIEPDTTPDNPLADNPKKEIGLTTKQLQLVLKGNTLAYGFLKEVCLLEKKDFMISPLGLQFALGMVMNGAPESVFSNACEVLNLGSITNSELNEYHQLMAKYLPTMDTYTKVEIANAAIVNNKYELSNTYKTNISKYYDALIESVDFSMINDVQTRINNWCYAHTHGLIPSIRLNQLSKDDVAVLLDALYFKGSWTKKFDKSKTSKEPFTLAKGTTQKLDMMKITSSFSVFHGDNFTGIILPFGNTTYRMNLILPNKGIDLNKVMEKNIFSANYIYDVYEVDLWLPKFKTSFSIDLNPVLSSIGLSCLLSGDFSKIADELIKAELKYQQDTFIETSEEGSSASAVTSVTLKYTSTGDASTNKKATIHFDRPFIYYISEDSTGAILFAGRYGANS